MTGFLTTRGVERYFRKHVLVTNRFSDLAPELFLIATQVNTSRKVVFGPIDSYDPARRYDPSCAYYDNVQISDALAGSVSVPPVFAPYAIVNPSNGKRFHYYDGEVRDALSAHVARDAGADFIITSSIWRPYQYDEQVGTLADLGMSALTEQAIHQTFEQKIDQDKQRSLRYQKILDMIERRESGQGTPQSDIEQFKSEVSEVLGHRPTQTLHVTPAPGDHEFFFSAAFRFDPSIVERCVQAGVRAYRWTVEQDRQFLRTLDQRETG
jgi:predicted acylesterase/phospholipase RssA